MATINTISIRSKIQKAAQGKRFEGLARSAANTRLVFAKLALVKAIDDDIVTQDIVEACENPAITQADIISRGNIAAAIGFYKGAHPIQDLKEVLLENIKMNDKPKVTLDQNKINFSFRVSIPSKALINRELVEKETGVEEWTTRSWLDLIENGITYLSRYIFSSKGFSEKANSRSGTGLQISGQVKNPADFNPQKDYLNNIFEEFKERFQGG